MVAISTLTANLELNSAQFRKEMDGAKARTRSYQKQAKSTAKTNNVLKGSFRGAAQGIAAIDGPLGGISSRISSVNGLLTASTAAWAGVGAAIAAVGYVTAKSIGAYDQMERQLLKTDALLKSTGMSAGRTAEQLDEQARAVARNTLANTQGVREAQQVLLTFRTVQGETFDQTISLSQDLAAVMGGTVKTAALQLGKALESPSIGLTLLRRSGVSFTDSEKERIKVLEESGRLTEAQTLILAKLQQQIGGAGAGESGGLSGSTDNLSQSWGELLEGWAKSTGSAGIAQAAIDGIALRMDNLRKHIAPTAEEMGRMRMGELHADYVRLGDALERVNRARMSPTRRDARVEAIKQERAALAAEMSAIQDAEKKRVIDRANEEAAAKAKADATRLQVETEAKAAAASRQQEKDQKENDRIVSMQQEKFRRIHESALLADEQMMELEAFRYEREQQQFEIEMERMQERGLLTQAVEKEFSDAKLEAKRIHEKKVSDIVLKEEQKRSQKQLALLSLVEKGGIAGKSRFAAVAMQVGKQLLDADKRNALKSALIAGKVAIVKAWSSAPFPMNMPAVALTAATTAAEIAGIQGIAHGGMTSIPKESTFLLDKGERVLSPNQNRDLTSFLKGGGNGGGPVINIHNYSGSEVEQRENGGQIDIIIGRVKDAISDDVSRGTGVSVAMQQAFGLNRAGTV